MGLLGKNRLVQKLRSEADELRKWMFSNSGPSVPVAEFADVANRYAIICTRIYIIEKQW